MQEKEYQYTLSISIPTYNRATRLSRSLDELRKIISRCEFRDSVSVYVSDNGSTDNTKDILAEQGDKFKNVGISFSYESVEANKGFDNNIKRCFSHCTADYCWFVSDDDNLEEDILEKIHNDIAEFNPNLIFHNFDQAPFSKNSPLISEKFFFISGKTDFAFTQLIQFPKLTSLVIKRIDDPLQREVFNYESVLSSGFSHIALAMQTAYHYGRILLSNNFSAKPDPDFRDHIDFPPYIGNRYNEMATSLFRHMGKPEWSDLHSGPHVDVGISALEWLTDYYKGRAVVPIELRLELYKGIKEYVAKHKYSLFLYPKFIRRCIYLAAAWLNYFILEKVLHIKITRQREKLCGSNHQSKL